MKKYGYFGKGLEGYMHYKQSFDENFSSDKNDYSDNSFDSDSYSLFDDDDDDEDDWEDDDEEEEELPTMTIDGTITLCPDESEFDFMMKFEDFLEENGWSFDGLTMDD